jgi:hypothetical protein
MIFIKTTCVGMLLDFVNSSLGYGLGSRVLRPWNLYLNLIFSMSTVLQCNITLRMLAYGMVPSTIDEDYKLGESTNMEAINHFNIGI